jgi:acyl-CoA thioesterase-1
MTRTLLALLLLASLPCAATGAAAAAAIQIVAFRDSATAGYLVARKDAYPAQLQAALRAKGHDVVVHNEGVNGDSTVGALRRFDMAIAPGTDIALIEFGTIDRRGGASLQTVQARVGEIVRSLRARRIQVLVIGLGSLDLSAVARAHGVPYAQFRLPPGQYRARDHAHFNAEGYRLLVQRTLPQVEALIAELPAR